MSGIPGYVDEKDDESKLQPWQLARLKYKCSVTLISLLESRKSDDIVYRMLKSMQVEIVKRNITDIYMSYYEIYKDSYNEDAFMHVCVSFQALTNLLPYQFNYEPDPAVSKLTEEYCSMIIETGFNLYFLLNNFLECKFTGSDEDTGMI